MRQKNFDKFFKLKNVCLLFLIIFVFECTGYAEFKDNGNDTISDTKTGLMWHRSTEPGHKRNTSASSKRRTWKSAVKYCENLTIGNYDDWRLPTIKELVSIVDYDKYNSAINEEYFTDIKNSPYWSSSSDLSKPKRGNKFFYMLVMSFGNGQLDTDWVLGHNLVRAVRTERTIYAEFKDNGNGTISDTKTGLMWQKSTASQKTWKSAVKYCENLTLGNYDDWRLPTIKELASILDYDKYNPAINKDFFPDTMSTDYGGVNYWSDTIDINTRPKASFAWRIDFFKGSIVTSYKNKLCYVRAVRSER